MKFEIDEESRMIHSLWDEDEERHPAGTSLTMLEQILQAVKKTQTKLINREIQSVQDSKNEKFVERTGLGYIKSVTIDGTKHTANEIEQNQKTIEVLKNKYPKIYEELNG